MTSIGPHPTKFLELLLLDLQISSPPSFHGHTDDLNTLASCRKCHDHTFRDVTVTMAESHFLSQSLPDCTDSYTLTRCTEVVTYHLYVSDTSYLLVRRSQTSRLKDLVSDPSVFTQSTRSTPRLSPLSHKLLYSAHDQQLPSLSRNGSGDSQKTQNKNKNQQQKQENCTFIKFKY